MAEHNDTHDSDEERPRRWRWFFLLFGVFTLATLLLALASGFWSQGQIERRIAELRAAGLPTSVAEIELCYPELPDDENATELWLRAAELLKPSAGSAAQRALPFVGEGRRPPAPPRPWLQQEAARQFLAEHAETLRLMHEAAQRGGRARLPNAGGPFAARLDSIQSLRSLARLSALDVNLHAHDGDAHATAESIRTGLLLSRALEDEPFMVTQLVHAALFGITAHELKQSLASVDFSNDDLLMLQNTLLNVDFHKGLTQAFVGDRAFGLDTFAAMTPANPVGRFGWRLLRDGDELAFLMLMDRLTAATALPWPQVINSADLTASQVNTTVSARRHPLTSTLVPSVKMMVDAISRCEAVRRLLLVAIGVERYRRQEGKPPAELSELVPKYLSELPADPTSGKQFDFKLKADGTGYVIYSPTERFPLPADEQHDPATGANPTLLFRWPAQDEKPDADASDANAGNEKVGSEIERPPINAEDKDREED